MSDGSQARAGKGKRARTPEQQLAREQRRLARYLEQNKNWVPTGKSRSVRTVSAGLPTLGKRGK